MDNSWVIFVEIIIAGVIFGFLFFRRKPKGDSDAGVRRVELKLSGAVLTPAVISVSFNHSTQLIVHRFDAEPAEELFEIDDLKVYALLPALHSTIIPFNPQQRGSFPIVLGGDRTAGTLTVV